MNHKNRAAWLRLCVPLTGLLFMNGCFGAFGGVLERLLSPTAFENALTIPSRFGTGLLGLLQLIGN